MGKHPNMNRREFIVSTAAVGGGMAIALTAPGKALAAFSNPEPWGASTASPAELTPWISIAPDGVVTIRVSTPEIGNGVLTQLPMTVNEELQADWSKVRAEYADTNRNYLENNVYSTAGAALAYFSGRSTGPDRTKLLLQVGASARERLKTAAAQQWGVPVGELTVENGVIRHAASNRTIGYGEVAAAAAAVTLESEPAPKPESEWTTLGRTSPGKLNNPLIVNGSAKYGIDIVLPDMVHAAIRQSPVMGGKLKSYDFDAIKDMPGVLAVVTVDPAEPRQLIGEQQPPFPLGLSAPQHAVAVIAEHYWQAKTALEALPVEWDPGEGAKWTTASIREAALAALDNPGEKVDVSNGDAVAMIAAAGPDKVIEARYYNPYCDHVNMEPLNGTCLVTADKVELWMPTQHTQEAHFVAADETSMDPAKVYVHQTFVGTGLGRRVFNDETRMVVAVARKFPGRPVKVIWSREESMAQGRYRPMAAGRFQATLGEDGLPNAFYARVSGRGLFLLGLVDTAYVNGIFPNVQVESQALPLHILTGPYRGPGYNSFCFMFECFIDELAEKAGVDPLEYRLKLFANYPDKGWALALNEAARQAEWGKTLPAGWGQGIAIGNWGMGGRAEAGTTVAVVATVEVKDGAVTIHRLDAAVDTGKYMNADALAYNLQGGLIMGTNMAFLEQMEVTAGAMSSLNYDVYPMIRTGTAPRVINVSLGGMSGNDRFGEIGESPMGPIGPAIANAIYKATGTRVREQPFRLQGYTLAG